MKLFKTINKEIVRLCQTYLSFQLPSVLLKNRTEQFRKRYAEYHYTCVTKLRVFPPKFTSNLPPKFIP